MSLTTCCFRNHMRILRRQIRDIANPFHIPSSHFKQMYRLDKQSTLNLIQRIEPYYDPLHSSIPLHIKVSNKRFSKTINIYHDVTV